MSKDQLNQLASKFKTETPNRRPRGPYKGVTREQFASLVKIVDERDKTIEALLERMDQVEQALLELEDRMKK